MFKRSRLFISLFIATVVVAAGSGFQNTASAAKPGQDCYNFRNTKPKPIKSGTLRVDVYKKKRAGGKTAWCWTAHNNVFSAADFRVIANGKVQTLKGKKIVGGIRVLPQGKKAYIEIQMNADKTKRGYEAKTFLLLPERF